MAETSEHIYEFGQEEHGEFHAGVLDVESGHQLLFGFGNIKRRAVGLGGGGDQIV